jgi:hypothetical protein
VADQTYRRLTQRPLYGLLFILLPLAVYHYGAIRHGTKILAPLHMRWLLEHLNATGWFLPPLVIVSVLLAQHIVHNHRWRVQPVVLVGMLIESLIWVVPLYCLDVLNAWLFQPDGAPAGGAAVAGAKLATDLYNALGAGVYEEFLFRLTLISLALLLMVDVFSLPRAPAATAAVLVGGILFSLYHFTKGQLTGVEAFPFSLFAFRSLAGAYLGCLFVYRGFGIAVGAHAAWNVAIALLA